MSYTRHVLNIIFVSFKVFVLSVVWLIWGAFVRPVFYAVRWILGR